MRWRRGAVVAAAMATLVAAVSPANATPLSSVPAAGKWPACDASMGDRLPVFVVHGFRSSPATWDGAVDTLGAVKGACFVPFDYTATSTQWVTAKDNARALAQLIVSYANRSARQGGPGKVAIVAHSTGGRGSGRPHP